MKKKTFYIIISISIVLLVGWALWTAHSMMVDIDTGVFFITEPGDYVTRKLPVDPRIDYLMRFSIIGALLVGDIVLLITQIYEDKKK